MLANPFQENAAGRACAGLSGLLASPHQFTATRSMKMSLADPIQGLWRSRWDLELANYLPQKWLFLGKMFDGILEWPQIWPRAQW